MKKIKITENELKYIISESVEKILENFINGSFNDEDEYSIKIETLDYLYQILKRIGANIPTELENIIKTPESKNMNYLFRSDFEMFKEGETFIKLPGLNYKVKLMWSLDDYSLMLFFDYEIANERQRDYIIDFVESIPSYIEQNLGFVSEEPNFKQYSAELLINLIR